MQIETSKTDSLARAFESADDVTRSVVRALLGIETTEIETGPRDTPCRRRECFVSVESRAARDSATCLDEALDGSTRIVGVEAEMTTGPRLLVWTERDRFGQLVIREERSPRWIGRAPIR